LGQKEALLWKVLLWYLRGDGCGHKIFHGVRCYLYQVLSCPAAKGVEYIATGVKRLFSLDLQGSLANPFDRRQIR
jgi:hypothetical protein